jgi:DNA-binding PadR family transcriptional regulator
MDPSASLPLTDLAFSILVALKGEDLHGYALLKELRARTGRERLRTGTVYAALARLQDDGWVEEAPGRRSRDEDPRRRYYRLTEEGAAVARAEAQRLADLLGVARNRGLLSPSEG